MNDPLRFGEQSCSTSLGAAGASASMRASRHIRIFWLAMTLSATVLLTPTRDKCPKVHWQPFHWMFKRWSRL